MFLFCSDQVKPPAAFSRPEFKVVRRGMIEGVGPNIKETSVGVNGRG
jgi:hypothetical protein